MNSILDQAREYITKFLKKKFGERDTKGLNVHDDLDLIVSGAVSSLEFIELIFNLEQEFTLSIDFEEYDLSNYTTVIGLARLVDQAAELSRQK